MEEVKRRSGLGEHYERLVASYSQGMRARLGLAVIERTEPTILLLDEIHEALDHEFRDHVEAYAHELVGGRRHRRRHRPRPPDAAAPVHPRAAARARPSAGRRRVRDRPARVPRRPPGVSEKRWHSGARAAARTAHPSRRPVRLSAQPGEIFHICGRHRASLVRRTTARSPGAPTRRLTTLMLSPKAICAVLVTLRGARRREPRHERRDGRDATGDGAEAQARLQAAVEHALARRGVRLQGLAREGAHLVQDRRPPVPQVPLGRALPLVARPAPHVLGPREERRPHEDRAPPLARARGREAITGRAAAGRAAARRAATGPAAAPALRAAARSQRAALRRRVQRPDARSRRVGHLRRAGSRRPRPATAVGVLARRPGQPRDHRDLRERPDRLRRHGPSRELHLRPLRLPRAPRARPDRAR